MNDHDPLDHRALAQRLGLLHFQGEAPGSVFWHPRGFAVLRALEEAIREIAHRQGFAEVRSPQLVRRSLWDKSGHWESFAEDMFRVDDGGEPAALKPVSCPGHIEIFRRMAPSYRDLPLRLSELGLCHRSELSGARQGLFRLRQFTQDDGHIFCREEDVEREVAVFCRDLLELYSDVGFEDVVVGFSTRPDVRVGDDAAWDRAEQMLASAAKQAGLSFVEQPGQGAFYGPKLEFILRDALGRQWQCGTIQNDLVLPERFDVSYHDADGERRRPVLLHRALLGSLERFLGILLEHSQGALPPWLAAEQARVIPVSPEVEGYGADIHASLADAGLRANLDLRSESLSRRIKDAHRDGVPFPIVIGAREVAAREVSVRLGKAQDIVAVHEIAPFLARRCERPASVQRLDQRERASMRRRRAG
ncbi:MAG: threonine--tRNA ligase [Deltaproteobacteria bacterium]